MSSKSTTTTFIFFPQPITISSSPSIKQSTSQNNYLYGWSASNSIVIAGAIKADSFEQAHLHLTTTTTSSSNSINNSLHQTDQQTFKLLGRCCQCAQQQPHVSSDIDEKMESHTPEKGKERALDQDGILPLHLSPTNFPSLCSMVVLYPTLIVQYIPPSPSRLQFLSLAPLQLDLTSFTSPIVIDKRGDRRRGAHDEYTTEIHQSEQSALGERVRKAISLDFVSSTNSCRGVIANLEEVVDWVSCCFFRPAGCPPTKLDAFHPDQSLVSIDRTSRTSRCCISTFRQKLTLIFPFIARLELFSQSSILASEGDHCNLELANPATRRNSAERFIRYQ
jgi:hypothetical protein